MHSSVSADRVHKCFVERLDPRDTHCSIVDGHPTQRVHSVRQVNVIGTPRRTRNARRANPYGLRRQRLFPLPKLNMPDQDIGRQVHSVRNRTTAGALFTMETCGNLHAG